MISKIEHISLSQLNALIGDAIATHLEPAYWVVAEVAEWRENYSGHCYLSLVEKDGDKVLAQSKAAIWQQTYRMVKPYFEASTGQAFSSGLKVRVKVSVSFHQVYGMNLTVQDIDPSYTVGEVILRRRQIFSRLEEDGVADMNKALDFSLSAQRIAIISSPTAAGYEDFINQLENNDNGFCFHTRLFPALMQGEGAEQSIIKAMEEVFEHIECFDVLVIIRGGGAALDLNCFDNYNMAFCVSQFPIPVLVGIGHERDETVLDLVAHTSLKTPTAVAAFLIASVREFDALLNGFLERLQEVVHQTTLREKERFHGVMAGLSLASSRIFSQKKMTLNHLLSRSEREVLKFSAQKRERIGRLAHVFASSVHELFLKQKQKMETSQLLADLSDPKHVLKQGYSITMKNGQHVKSAKGLEKDDKLITVFHEGSVESRVEA